MSIDTGIYRDVALGLACRRKAFVESANYSIVQRHSQIQSLVNGLVNHLNQSANVYEAAENNLWNSGYISTYIQNGTVQTTHYENWNAVAHLMKQDKKTHLSASASWAYKEAGATFHMRYASVTARAKIGQDVLLLIALGPSSIVGVKNVTSNEPFFTGHFPQEPVMPGVLQVEAMAQCGGLLVLNTVDEPERWSTYFMKIDDVKFRQKVVPGDTLLFKVDLLAPVRHGVSSMKGYVFVGDKVVSEATFTAQIVKNK